MEDEIEDIDSTNDETEEVLNTDESEVLIPDDEETEDDGSELLALQEKNKRLFERAKKAEAEAKALKGATAPPTEKQEGISAMDAMALMNAKVTEEEDINEVVEYAKFKNISISEALKASTVKTILAERTETRKTAQAANTGNARRGSSKLSDEQVLTNAEQGKYPDDPEALAEARMNARKNKK